MLCCFDPIYILGVGQTLLLKYSMKWNEWKQNGLELNAFLASTVGVEVYVDTNTKQLLPVQRVLICLTLNTINVRNSACPI